MHRNMIRWTVLISLVACTFGCAGDPPPMVVLMPTYSFNRDIAETANGPVRFDPVANAEP